MMMMMMTMMMMMMIRKKKLTELLSTYNTDTSSQTMRNKQRNDKAIKTSAKEINNTYTLQKI